MGAAGWKQGGPEQDLHRFGSDLGNRAYQFFGFKKLEMSFCSGLFPVHVFYRFLSQNFDAGDFKLEVRARKELQTSCFTEIVFMNFGVGASRF